ncbi:long-chain-fatty-acid--CoA ligase [Oceanobacillus halophilus]|uniref:Long-chain fatty acid--CoA ligase n=1 Tax=Oceanobacillus halophilus TaxID=930130 RepID=A0A495A7F1_9BACI|nr:long-chain-fatty-acid--CoA ligase [Oceanobacillus halophilus]RKQ35732.1 long-chain fatty acid--CoA ligase [Oceanobacillus halophilus]
MLTRHYEHWPFRLTKQILIPNTTLYNNLEISAKRYPDNIAINYYGSNLTYKQLIKEVDALAGFLQHRLGIKKGDKVLLLMQNSPQYIIGYYAILRADAIVVPLNPMLKATELEFYINDCDIKNGIIGQELLENVDPLLEEGFLNDIILAAYSDYISDEFSLEIPEEVALFRKESNNSNHHLWIGCIESYYKPNALSSLSDDLAVIPYTSGTTGIPKGCMHTNRTVQANTVGGAHWNRINASNVHLATLPFFHVTGMVGSMHTPLYAGSTIVIMTRWNRQLAAELISHNKCTNWVAISTMVTDFLANPNLRKEQLSSLISISGGGATLPEAVGQRLYKLSGIRFTEGYGLTETIAQTHQNPGERPKMQCLGIPVFGVDARIINPNTHKEVNADEEGEIIVSGPQVMIGYYNRDDENEKVFINLDGKCFFRTGDIGRYDEDGYFYIVDRVKRMINASGFKVWPTEVESYLYKHPAVHQACVIGVPDSRRGETIKAFIILNTEYKGRISEEEIIEWTKKNMAAYKYPRYIEFKSDLPTTSSGKILWRKLQEEELKKVK